MTFASDIADDLDFAITDFGQSVRLRSVAAAGDATSSAFLALRSQITKDDLQGSPILADVPGTVWNIKANSVPIEPKQNDKIIEQASPGVTWTVLSVQVATLGTRYRLVCQRDR